MELIYEKLIDAVACFLYDLTDADSFEEIKDIKYKPNWLSDFITKYDGSVHDGDCTQKPYACNQCIIDSYREDAKALVSKEAFIKYIIDEEIGDYVQIPTP